MKTGSQETSENQCIGCGKHDALSLNALVASMRPSAAKNAKRRLGLLIGLIVYHVVFAENEFLVPKFGETVLAKRVGFRTLHVS